MAKKRVLGVVGMGHVGAHVAYALAIQGIADELVLVDQNEQKLASEVQDLRDAVAYMPHRVTVRGGDFSDLGVCDVIVNSVGKIDLLRGTHDRVTEMDFTIPAVRGYAEKIKASGFDGVLINITGSEDMGLEDVETAANLVQEAAHPDANIIFGASFDPSLDDEIRVSVIATGFDEPGKAPRPLRRRRLRLLPRLRTLPRPRRKIRSTASSRSSIPSNSTFFDQNRLRSCEGGFCIPTEEAAA